MFNFFKKLLYCLKKKKLRKINFYYIKKYGSEGNRFIINNEL